MAFLSQVKQFVFENEKCAEVILTSGLFLVLEGKIAQRKSPPTSLHLHLIVLQMGARNLDNG
jgi:hypothetical protein